MHWVKKATKEANSQPDFHNLSLSLLPELIYWRLGWFVLVQKYYYRAYVRNAYGTDELWVSFSRPQTEKKKEENTSGVLYWQIPPTYLQVSGLIPAAALLFTLIKAFQALKALINYKLFQDMKYKSESKSKSDE